MLDAVFKQIETGLPLNQLYVDLNNDEYLTNDKEISDAEVQQALENMIPPNLNIDDKIKFLDQMAEIEPFENRCELIEKLRKDILKNG